MKSLLCYMLGVAQNGILNYTGKACHNSMKIFRNYSSIARQGSSGRPEIADPSSLVLNNC